MQNRLWYPWASYPETVEAVDNESENSRSGAHAPS
jgi:hypothetical protein